METGFLTILVSPLNIFKSKDNKWVVLNLHVCLKLNFKFTLNPLTPKSEWHLTSLYNISTKTCIKAMRIKEMITNY